MSERNRQESREAFILHSYPYRETSLLLEVFTRAFGRMTMVARGARRPRSAMRGVLLSFQPLALAWFGKGEVRTLARAEWIGGQPLLRGEALLCGFYLNELLVRLLPREDAHDSLFDQYRHSLRRLASEADSPPLLRAFEKALLREIGYAMTLLRDSASGGEIDPRKTYRYDPERGPIEARDDTRGEARDDIRVDTRIDGRSDMTGGGAEPLLSGRTLLDMARDDYRDPVTQLQAKALMRSLINHRLDYQPLKSRQIFKDLLQL